MLRGFLAAAASPGLSNGGGARDLERGEAAATRAARPPAAATRWQADRVRSVEAGSSFQDYLAAAVETFGIETDETERAVMAGAWSIWEPGMSLLRDAELDGVEPELDADLSAPPRR